MKNWVRGELTDMKIAFFIILIKPGPILLPQKV